MELKRAFDFLYHQKERFPKTDSLAHKINGQWKHFSTQEVIDEANKLSLAFLESGIKQGDRVALISENRPGWVITDFALQQIGAVSVPLYPTITIEDYKYIFEHAEVKMIFVSTEELYQKASKAAEGLGDVEIYTYDNVNNAKHWTEIAQKGEGKDADTLIPLRDVVKEDDLLTIIYTSGTTGKPKGVMLTHKNIVSNAITISAIAPIEKGVSRALSFLPVCHIFERTGLYYYMYMGTSIYFAESLEKIGDNLREVKPHIFNTVPRLLEKVYDKIVSKGLTLKGIKRALFFWALNLGLKYNPSGQMGFAYNLQLKLANKLIFSKWREALGGNIKVINVGAAALQHRLIRVFWAGQIKICEGYGLTETSPVISANITTQEGVRVGTVGPVIEGVKVKIADDGEVLCKGPNVMKGYYKNEELTAKAIDKDGWFHTGDIGELVEDKFLKITDRKKEMFKTSGGKYIAPQVMENKFKESFLIEQMAVIGNNRKFPSALIVPNFERLREWCEIKGVHYTSNAEMVLHNDVQDKFEREVSKFNENFAQWEKVKKYTVLPYDWSVDTGELTPTMKLKRRVITDKYSREIEEMYL